MARKDKKKVEAKPVTPAAPQPYVYTFRPVQLETPVEVIQRFNYVTSTNQNFSNNIQAQEAKKVEDKKAKKRRK